MAKQRNREEVVNTQLAILISKLGVTADAETIHVHGKHRPDVLFQMFGLRVVIEGKFDDHSSAEKVVFDDALRRVTSGIAHIACAVIYPKPLRSAPTTKILATFGKVSLRYRIVTETHETDWYTGSPADIMNALRRAQETLTKDDIVDQAAKALSLQLETVSGLWVGQTGACDRLSNILGINPPKGESPEKATERRDTAAKVSALVLANAYIFQEQLAKSDTRVDTLRRIKKNPNIVGETADHWRWIWENINYVPIFQLGEKVLTELPESPSSTRAVEALLGEAQTICRQQAALRHDLMGRIYHRLLHEAKFLGTYYTSVSAATLLLKLALSLDWKQDFASPRKLADFKVADLACGTGTLLMAAAQALMDRFICDRTSQDLSLSDNDISVFHQTLMQNILHGYDVLPTAVHLTASTLALLAPDVAFRNMNLFVMPMGIDKGGLQPRLGSLDFLGDSLETWTQFSLDNTHLDTMKTGASSASYTRATVPKLDLCVMNPPFVSSRYGNRLFGSLPKERAALQKELSKQAKKLGVSATAGLGALFVPLAEKHVNIGGRIAFVLPVALATGEAWGTIRRRIATGFHLEIVITSHDSERPNFSESTSLSEILFIARRLAKKEKAGATIYVNLWQNPRSIHEALNHATRISAEIATIKGREGQNRFIQSSAGVLGEITSLPAPVDSENWTGAIFAQCYLMQAHWALNTKNEVWLPGESKGHKISLCRLDELGPLGYDARDIFDAFDVDKTATTWSPYPAFWNHDAKKVVTVAQKPNATLLARTEALPGRKLKVANTVWSKAGHILLVSRLWPVTHRVLAIGLTKKTLGNTWWAFDDSMLNAKQRKVFLLWMNSTLGILSYFGRRAITRSAWMQMKKPAWSSMPVLDVRALTKTKLNILSKAYDDLSKKNLAPIAHLDSDPVRMKIDAVLGKVLRIPDLHMIRELLAREPGLSAQSISQQFNEQKDSG